MMESVRIALICAVALVLLAAIVAWTSVKQVRRILSQMREDERRTAMEKEDQEKNDDNGNFTESEH